MPVYVGTSGWQYRHWRDRLYPKQVPQARWLEHYAERFRVVEVNNTFYRLPKRATFEHWLRQTPSGFTFALKLSRYLSHVKRLKDPDPIVARFLDAASGLGDKLGPLLLQLSPSHTADPERLDAALAAFPAGFRVAVEFRHTSWFNREIRKVLEHRDAALCLADRGGVVTPLWRTTRWGYVRFHGGGASPPGCYGARNLASWASRIAELWPDRAEVFAFFNNDTHGCAVRDAVVFAGKLEQVDRSPSRVPPIGEAAVA